MLTAAASGWEIYVPLIVALFGGGGLLGWYTAKPNREGIIADASQKAVQAVSVTLDEVRSELIASRERIRVLEEQLKTAHEERDKVHTELIELRIKVRDMEIRLERAGVDDIYRKGDPDGK